jgi:CRISPR-associated protein Cas1
MGWRTVYITNKNTLSLFLNNLKVKTNENPLSAVKENDKTISIPLNDISVIVLDNLKINISVSLLSKLASFGIVLFVCDDKHMPSGIYIPFNNHSRLTEISKLQTKLSEPFKKRCWQKIIQAKILNQAKVIKSLHIENYILLENLSKRVLSGDTSNIEGQAAKIYWKLLFSDFIRTNKLSKIKNADIRNIALNYGYSIIRGVIARSIAAAGLFPSIGIHHSNDLNAFNLADDLIEPFRPFVDIKVYNMYKDDNAVNRNFTKIEKIKLLELLQKNAIIDNKEETVLNAIEQNIYSFIKSIKEKEPDNILFPLFL